MEPIWRKAINVSNSSPLEVNIQHAKEYHRNVTS